MSSGTGGIWHALSLDEVFRRLHAVPGGLTSRQAEERLAELGPNLITVAAVTSSWRILLRQFASPLITLLLISGTVTLFLQRWVDTAAIFLVLIGNAVVGFYQENKAEHEVAALRAMSVPTCRALRDGAVRVLSAERLVPGDLVLLESGERVPADVRITESNNLRIDESMLTGEVLPATKSTAQTDADASIGDRRGSAYSGTLVATGRGMGIVVATGFSTALGEISELIQVPATVAPLQRIIHQLERQIGIVVGIVSGFVLVGGIVAGLTVADAFLSAITLAVAAIPEGLPIVLTVAMSLGVSRMAKRNAVVRSLPAIETLGSTTVIGTDKTGTLTENRMTVERVWAGGTTIDLTSLEDPSAGLGGPGMRVLRAGALTNEARVNRDTGRFSGDAVDAAMAQAAVGVGAALAGEINAPALAHTPYESELRYSQTVRRDTGGTRVLYVKGAPDVLIAHSDTMLTAHGVIALDRSVIEEASHRMAKEGLRVIATAERVLSEDEIVGELSKAIPGLTFLGLEGMVDPPRAGVFDAIRACRRAGIAVKMITGDNPVTAAAVGARLGLEPGDAPLTGSIMAGINDDELALRLRRTSIAARVSPQDKLRIVKVLQAQGEVVAITGDGVNDAPALKAASIGVAMGRSGTEVAREAAGIVLTDDNFVTIVEAVRQGRITFSAIRRTAFFLFSNSVAALLAVSINVLTDTPLLFLPVQMLWFNLVLNGLQDIALAFEPGEGDELDYPPRSPNDGLFSSGMWFRIMLTGAWMGVGVLLLFHWAIRNGYDVDHARTLALTLFAFLNFFQTGNARSERRSIFSLLPWANPLVLAAALLALVLHATVVHTTFGQATLGLVPLAPQDWLLCAGLGASVLVIVEIDKWIKRAHTAEVIERNPG